MWLIFFSQRWLYRGIIYIQGKNHPSKHIVLWVLTKVYGCTVATTTNMQNDSIEMREVPFHRFVPPLLSFLTCGAHWSDFCRYSLGFSGISFKWSYTLDVFFASGFFHLAWWLWDLPISCVSLWYYCSITVLFYGWVVFLIWLYQDLFIHSPVHEHLDGFHFLALTRNAAMNICVQLFCVNTYVYFSRPDTQEWNVWVMW